MRIEFPAPDAFAAMPAPTVWSAEGCRRRGSRNCSSSRLDGHDRRNRDNDGDSGAEGAIAGPRRQCLIEPIRQRIGWSPDSRSSAAIATAKSMCDEWPRHDVGWGMPSAIGASPSTAVCAGRTVKQHAYLPIAASTSALRKRSTSSMNRIDGTRSRSAVIDAIW